jgi:hypothetical protein
VLNVCKGRREYSEIYWRGKAGGGGGDVKKVDIREIFISHSLANYTSSNCKSNKYHYSAYSICLCGVSEKAP